MSYYSCKRCLLKTKNFTDIKRHFNKKIKCSKEINNFNNKEEELFVYSLIPYNDNIQNINYNEVLINKNILKDKDKLFDEISYIEKNKLKTCKYCNTTFSKIQDLKNHFILKCFSILLNEIYHSEPEVVEKIYENNITNNVTHITNNNITNITINVNTDSIISFDKDWDVSHLCGSTKQSLVISFVKYTKTLEYILKNDKNINVLLDKDSDKGFIYKNNNFEEMSKNDIIEKSFLKIYNHIKKFIEDIKYNNEYCIDVDLLEKHNEILDSKYNKYYTDNLSKSMIQEYLIEKYENVKEKAFSNYNTIMNINDKIIREY
jgi:hypothetical protein